MTGAVRALAALATGLAISPVLQQPTFRSVTEGVVLEVLVTERNRPVRGLTSADFHVTDNGVPQRVLDVSHETLPLDVHLVTDTSGSIHPALLQSLVRSVNRVRQQLRPEDRVSVLPFNHQVREQVWLTPAGNVGEIGLESTGGRTSLNDAIALALIAPLERDRRQMAIVFTDGFDTTSFMTEAATLDVARRSHVALFVVAAGDRKTLPARFLEEVASTTGGLAQIAQPVQAVEQHFLRALEEFRTSYVVRYVPEGVERGGWHDVSVRVSKRGRYQVRARRGYFGAR